MRRRCARCTARTRRSRRRRAVRRRAAERHRMVAVGPRDRPAGRRGANDRSQGCARARWPGPVGCATPGLLHFYIHLMEMSPHAGAGAGSGERAARAGPRRRSPACTCRPTSTSCVGDYERVIADNERAIIADDRYVADAGRAQLLLAVPRPRSPFPDLWRDVRRAPGHRAGCSRRAGRRAARGTAARRVAADGRLAGELRGDAATRAGALRACGTRSSREPLPERPTALQRHHGADPLRQGRGLRRASRGRGGGARSASSSSPRSRGCPRRATCSTTPRCDILAIAVAMLDGEIAYRSGDYETAWAHLRHAIELDDTLPYDEPWGWMQPTRHAYGALLLEQGEIEAALAVYAADLGSDGDAPQSLPAPQQRLEPARLPRVPDPVGACRRGRVGQAPARPSARGRGHRHHLLVLLPP